MKLFKNLIYLILDLGAFFGFLFFYIWLIK